MNAWFCQVALVGVLIGWCACVCSAGETRDLELLLDGGALYSVGERAYRSFKIPENWKIVGGAYSPDGRWLALLLTGHGETPRVKPTEEKTLGAIYKLVQSWAPSTRLLLIERASGAVHRSWRVPSQGVLTGSVAWTSATLLRVLFRRASLSETGATVGVPFNINQSIALSPVSVAPDTTTLTAGDCPRPLAQTHVQDKLEQFSLDAARCATPPEPSDVFRVTREGAPGRKDLILWEYRVVSSTAACPELYSCYTGSASKFWPIGDRLYLMWDADLYDLRDTEDGTRAELVSQLLPQYSRPWDITSGPTVLPGNDVSRKGSSQPANESFTVPKSENPMLYVQNFCATRSFNVIVQVGDYTKTAMVPAGEQVGPIEIGSFKDRSFTPIRTAATWHAFHHVVDSVRCEFPYTMTETSSGVIASLHEAADGTLTCHIDFQEAAR